MFGVGAEDHEAYRARSGAAVTDLFGEGLQMLIGWQRLMEAIYDYIILQTEEHFIERNFHENII